MKVLVAVASRHGATREIAGRIAGELDAAGVKAELFDVDDVATIDEFDAVVLGSAVYLGNWLAEARRFVERHRQRLAEMPVWLFSSGPLGEEDPKPQQGPEQIAVLAASIQARDYHIFVGKLDPHALGFGERLVARAVHAPVGDFRDWQEVAGWARSIAARLAPAPVPGR